MAMAMSASVSCKSEGDAGDELDLGIHGFDASTFQSVFDGGEDCVSVSRLGAAQTSRPDPGQARERVEPSTARNLGGEMSAALPRAQNIPRVYYLSL